MKIWKKNMVAAAVLVTVCAGIYVNWLYTEENVAASLTETLDAEKVMSDDLLVLSEDMAAIAAGESIETTATETTEFVTETTIPTTEQTEPETQPIATETVPKETTPTVKPSTSPTASSNSGNQSNNTPTATQPTATEPPATQPAPTELPTVPTESTGQNPNLGGETPEENDDIFIPDSSTLETNGSLSAETPED